MQQSETRAASDLIATLNDLLELDHDAVSAYSIAIDTISRDDWKQDLSRFRDDHHRHIADLTTLVIAHDGEPALHPHVPTGALKSAVQAAAAAGGDRAILLAFKANEEQVRDRYRRAADRNGHPADVAAVIERNARDEVHHYEWCVARLHSLGVGADTAAGRMASAAGRVHGATATAMEEAERVARSRPWIGGLVAAAAVGAATAGAAVMKATRKR